MSKKERCARRNAKHLEKMIEKLDLELTQTKIELSRARHSELVLSEKVASLESLSIRLSNSEMRTRINKNGNVYAVQIQVSEEMLRDIYYYGKSNSFENIIGSRIKLELERKAFEINKIISKTWSL